MIARCPECQAGYRIAPEKLGPRGARIQCARCQHVFRVPPPAESAGAEARAAAAVPAARPAARPAGAGALVLVAESDAAKGKAIAAALERRGLAVELVANGADALLQIHRKRPACAVLGGRLPGIGAPALCEIVRRTAELSGVRLVRVAPVEERAGAPEFEADQTLEPADLPEGVARALEKLGLAGAAPAAARPAAPAAPAAKPTPAPAAKPTPAPAAARPAAPAAASAGSSDGDQVAAERLARIIISDIILYNEEKFHAALRDGTIATALETELREAGQMFAQRVPESLRSKRDFLHEELMRRANKLLGGC